MDLLKQYYLEAIDLISFELISEIKKTSGPRRKLSMSEMFDKKV